MTRTLSAVAIAVACGMAQPARAQAPTPPPPAPTLTFEQPPGSAAPPVVLTLLDAIERARANDAQFQSASADATFAHEDRSQAKAALLPALSFTTQYLGTQGDTP